MNDDRSFDGYVYGSLGYVEMHENLMPKIKPGMSVLELGIGTGHMASPLAIAGAILTGVDLDESWLNRCRETYDSEGLGDRLQTVLGDVLDFLNTTPDKFDVVMMSDMLMFNPKSKSKLMVEKAYQVIAPGGYMWITTMSTGDELYDRIQSCPSPEPDTYVAWSQCHGDSLFSFWRPGEIEAYLTALGATLIFGNEGLNSADGIYNMVLVQKPN